MIEDEFFDNRKAMTYRIKQENEAPESVNVAMDKTSFEQKKMMGVVDDIRKQSDGCKLRVRFRIDSNKNEDEGVKLPRLIKRNKSDNKILYTKNIYNKLNRINSATNINQNLKYYKRTEFANN